MGTQTVSINITAKDGATSTFTRVASAARSAFSGLASGAKQGAGGLKELGSAGTAASAGIDKLDGAASKAAGNLNKTGTSAKQAATGVSDLGSKATSTGAALGAMVGALGKFGAAAETQRRQVDGLRKAYGEAADEILAFTERVQDSTTFSNEDAREAAQIAATLAQNYGFQAEEIEKLISVSADLAAVKGIDLADAVQRTSSAMRGEAESAEFLGLTLNQQSIDREGLTLKMSNEEAAHFRLNALLSQAAYAEGAAGTAAATAAGQAAQLGNAMQDVATNVGAMLGPVAGSAAGLADMSLALTLVGAGIGKGIAQLGEWNAGAKASAAASRLLAASLTPVGAALGAATLIVGAAVFAWADLQAQNETLATSFDNLDESIKQLDTADARQNVRGLVDEIAQLNHMPLASAGNSPIENIVSGLTSSAAELKAAFIDATSGMIDTAENVGVATGDVEHAVENMVGAVTSGSVRLEDATTAFDTFSNVMEATGPNIELVQGYVQGLYEKFADGSITAEQFAAAMQGITDVGIGDWADNAAQMLQRQFDQMEAQTQAFHTLSDAQKAYLDGEANRVKVGQEGVAQMQHEADVRAGLEQGINNQWRAMNVQTDAYNTQIAAAKEYEAEQERIAEAQRQVADELRGQLVPALDGASHGFDGMVQPGEDVLDTLSRIAPQSGIAGGAFLQFADNLNDASQALNGVLASFAAIDSLGAGAGQAQDIASKLVGDPGTWATLDDLLASGAISVEQYGAAEKAAADISASNLAIQEDLNAVRANQLPLLDSQVTKLAAYVDGLAGASAAEQQQALYLMDSANQAKVASAYSTAYAASLGEIPESVATEIVADAAQADPILGDILESFGLIEVGADGTITLNFPDKTVLDDTTTAINNLNNSQIEMFIALIDGKVTEDELSAVEDHLVAVDGKEVNAKVSVDVDDSGLTTLSTALASGAGFGAGVGITVDVNANTEPLMAGIADVKPAPIEVPIKLGAVETQMPSEADISSKFDTSAQDQTVTVTLDAVDNASPVIARVMQAATALQAVSGSVDLKATDNASSVIARVMQAANALQSVSGSITLNAEDNTGGVIAQAMQAANAFSGGTYDATLSATDASGSVVAQAMQAANAYATGEYNASLVATDSASGPVIQPAIDLATSFANGEYNASLVATDSASSVIQSAIDLATSFASEYSATLTAVDNASGVINSVSAALDALDGKTATTYVTTQEVSSLPAKALGGAVQMPTARLGRNVLVGEAGPEVVTMPFGAFVKPHGAEGAEAAPAPATTDDSANEKRDRQRAQDAERAQHDYERRLKEMQEQYDKFLAHAEKTGGSLLPHVDSKHAYEMGGESAKAFYDGLLDAAKSRMSSTRDEINSTRYGSKDAALAAIQEYKHEYDEWRTLQDKKAQGADYDRKKEQQAKREARAEERASVESTAKQAVDTMATAGTQAGQEFSSNLSESMDTGSVIDQVMKLKDEFLDSMKASAGATDDVTGAVESFNSEVAQIVGTFKGVGKTGERELGGVSDSFGDVEGDAEDMGKTVGDELGDGITAGAEDATDALGLVSQMLGAVSSQAVDPSVGIDAKSAQSGIKDVSSQLSALNSTQSTPGVDVKVDDSEWQAFKDDVDAAQLGVVVHVKTKEDKPKKQLGGAIGASLDREVPRAANGRVVTVGEAGEEDVLLPYGAMVMPHDATLSRRAADAATSGNIQFFGPVTIVPPTPDLHAAVVSQFMSIDRD